jgi:hypothetical protein
MYLYMRKNQIASAIAMGNIYKEKCTGVCIR